MKKHLLNKKLWQGIFLVSFALFMVLSVLLDYGRGIAVGKEFASVIWSMLKILPCAFLLIALFEVWVKRETVERHLGAGASVKGYFWAMLLGGMSVGGMYVAFPLAYTLFRKGASLRIIFCFLGFAGVCRIPMTIFETVCLGWKFTFIRLTSGIVLMLIAGITLGCWLEKKDYQLTE